MQRLTRLFAQLVCVLLLGSTAYALDCPEEAASIFPQCKEAKVIQTMKVRDALMVSLQTRKSTDAAYASYKAAAQKAGWNVLMETKQDESNILMCDKGQQQMVVNMHKDEDATMIQITLGKKN